MVVRAEVAKHVSVLACNHDNTIVLLAAKDLNILALFFFTILYPGRLFLISALSQLQE